MLFHCQTMNLLLGCVSFVPESSRVSSYAHGALLSPLLHTDSPMIRDLSSYLTCCPRDAIIDGDEGCCLNIWRVSQVSSKAVRASILRYLHCSLKHVILHASWDANNRDLSFFGCVSVDASR